MISLCILNFEGQTLIFWTKYGHNYSDFENFSLKSTNLESGCVILKPMHPGTAGIAVCNVVSERGQRGE